MNWLWKSRKRGHNQDDIDDPQDENCSQDTVARKSMTMKIRAFVSDSADC
jgi:hypothetical protein